MAELPSGTVTFLLTDVEGSTALWEEAPEAMRAALARHDALFRAAVHEHGGHVRPRRQGDSRFHAVFARAPDAVAAALDASARCRPSRGKSAPSRVRMALHTGEAELRDGDYYGLGGEPLRAPAERSATAARCCSPRRPPCWSATPCPMASACSTSGGIGSRT